MLLVHGVKFKVFQSSDQQPSTSALSVTPTVPEDILWFVYFSYVHFYLPYHLYVPIV
jgi:hypothetical protein